MWLRVLLMALGMCAAAARCPARPIVYDLAVLPPEHRRMVDPETGANLLFLSSGAYSDTSLYFEQRSWLADSSMIVFNSTRPGGALLGYLAATGELVRLATPSGPLSHATCARLRNSVIALRGRDIVDLGLRIVPAQPGGGRSRVIATERVLGSIPAEWMDPNSQLTENANGTLVGLGASGVWWMHPEKPGRVLTVNVRTGRVREVFTCKGERFAGHVVFSRTDPNLISFGLKGTWISVVDVRTGRLVFQHLPFPGDFATHHCWWRGSLFTFTGGFHPQPNEDADVKTIDMRTGTIRIVGRGNWWPGAKPIELARANWWHACGDDAGRWIAADNWHGDIALFHAMTTRTIILTRGHRTYGVGTHPEVGWDRLGRQVIFSSHRLGTVHACVATIPQAWQDAWKNEVSAPQR